MDFETRKIGGSMNYSNGFAKAFGLVFLLIVAAGITLSFSLTFGLILLAFAFTGNVMIFICLFFCAALSLDEGWDLSDDMDVHP